MKDQDAGRGDDVRKISAALVVISSIAFAQSATFATEGGPDLVHLEPGGVPDLR